jgi:hypothetical protein
MGFESFMTQEPAQRISVVRLELEMEIKCFPQHSALHYSLTISLWDLCADGLRVIHDAGASAKNPCGEK